MNDLILSEHLVALQQLMDRASNASRNNDEHQLFLRLSEIERRAHSAQAHLNKLRFGEKK